ncbi:hypothetical protein SNEBB_000110, partial [Seison nebaliae]
MPRATLLREKKHKIFRQYFESRRSKLLSSSSPSFLSIDNRQQHFNEIINACKSLKYFIESNIQSVNSFSDIGRSICLLELETKRELSHRIENIVSVKSLKTFPRKKLQLNNVNRLPKVTNTTKKKVPIGNSMKLLESKRRNKMIEKNKKNDIEVNNSSLSQTEIDDEEKKRLISQLETYEKQSQGINYELSDSRYIYRGWTVIEDNIPLKPLYRTNDRFNPNRMSLSSIQSSVFSRTSSGKSSIRERKIEYEKKLYRNGSEFSLIFTDQTGYIKYPSGELACLISRKKDNYLYTLFFRKDEVKTNNNRNQSFILGSIQSAGKCIINDINALPLPKLIYNRHCGYLLNNGPQNILKNWACSDIFPPNIRETLKSIRRTKEYGIRRIRQKWYWTQNCKKEFYTYFDTQYKRFLISRISKSDKNLVKNIEDKSSSTTFLFQPIVCQLSQHWSIRLNTRDNIIITFNCAEKKYSLDVHKRYKAYENGNLHNGPNTEEGMNKELNQDTRYNYGDCNVNIFLGKLEKINKRIKDNEMKLKKSLNSQR